MEEKSKTYACGQNAAAAVALELILQIPDWERPASFRVLGSLYANTGRRTMIIRKSDFEIEAKLMDRLRSNRSCEALKGFKVLPDGNDGRWYAQPLVAPGAHLPFDGERAVIQVTLELACQYRLLQQGQNARRRRPSINKSPA